MDPWRAPPQATVDAEAPTLPAAPAERPPYSFPAIATIAPVIASVVIWLLTQSPFALIFALLGPVIAIASLADATVQRRRGIRSERRRFDAELAETLRAIGAFHDAERSELAAAHPDVRALIAGTAEADGWTGDGRSALTVRIGRGTVRSTLALGGLNPQSRVLDVAVAAGLRAAREAAARLEDAPVVVDARLGIGVCGPPAPAEAAARACILQLAHSLSPMTTTIRADSATWGWAESLPHRLDPGELSRDGAGAHRLGNRFEFVVHRSAGADEPRPGRPAVIIVAVARRAEQLPRHCGVIVTAGTGGSASSRVRGASGPARELRPDFASEQDAVVVAAGLRARATTEGLALMQLPRRVSLHDLDVGGDGVGHGLACAVGSTGTGTWFVDIVADGPHAVIGGTTGSGKSELLISWVLSMAAAHPPSAVNFLLVDFKGGASFNPIGSLPHSVGVITDLDAGAARRALESLRAELLFRERALTLAGAKSIAEARQPGLPRLVIVVDEFAALASEFPELHNLFADLASRGRSLGIHLILCTQRPAEALRDAILANCSLRVALRLSNRADSSAVIGTGAAADLPRRPLGRALASVAGEEPREVQVAISDDADAARVAGLWCGPWRTRRPWCDPLPALVPHGELADTADPAGGAVRADPVGPAGGAVFVFGVSDVPREQRRGLAVYRPRSHGNLLICGAQGAGKSTLLDAIVAGGPRGAARLLPGDLEGGWDAVASLSASLAAGTPRPGVVLLDDVDSVLARFDQEHQLEFADLLARLLREGPRHGTTVVLATQLLPTALHSITALCGSRLLLRLPTRQDHLLAGGRGDQYDEHLPPGGGIWDSHRVQAGYLPPRQPHPAPVPAVLDLRPGATTAVVSASPRDFASRTRGGPGIRIVDVATPGPPPDADRHTVLLGDPQAWQAAWSTLAAIRGRIPIAFHGCTVGDFRAVTGSRRLPPPLAPASGSLWLLAADDTLARATMPGQAG